MFTVVVITNKVALTSNEQTKTKSFKKHFSFVHSKWIFSNDSFIKTKKYL